MHWDLVGGGTSRLAGWQLGNLPGVVLGEMVQDAGDRDGWVAWHMISCRGNGGGRLAEANRDFRFGLFSLDSEPPVEHTKILIIKGKEGPKKDLGAP